jgi:DNA-binding beta-propeller fold protein YncE
VLDADTGAYKRHWGAYGHKPPDGPLGGNPIEGPYKLGMKSENFATVHCLIQSKDDLIYVCDGRNDRIQVFKRDGTFVKEQWVGANATGTPGSAVCMAMSPDQKFLYLGDAANHKIWIIRRDDLKVLGSFPNSAGRNGGQVLLVHALAVDSKGNIYVGETTDNDRVQRFKFVGMGGPKG